MNYSALHPKISNIIISGVWIIFGLTVHLEVNIITSVCKMSSNQMQRTQARNPQRSVCFLYYWGSVISVCLETQKEWMTLFWIPAAASPSIHPSNHICVHRPNMQISFWSDTAESSHDIWASLSENCTPAPAADSNSCHLKALSAVILV